jgi:protein Mpv17
MITGGVLALLGDAIAQSRQNDEYDEKRASSIVIFDLFYRALQCYLFPVISQVCKGQYFGQIFREVNVNSLAAWEQTLVNQLIIIPIIYYPLFFLTTGFLQNLSWFEIFDRASKKFKTLLKRNWLFWIPVQYIQFRFIAEPFQIPFLCIVGLVWTFILSISTGSVKTEQVVNVALNSKVGLYVAH